MKRPEKCTVTMPDSHLRSTLSYLGHTFYKGTESASVERWLTPGQQRAARDLGFEVEADSRPVDHPSEVNDFLEE